jgi:hypothetical protein
VDFKERVAYGQVQVGDKVDLTKSSGWGSGQGAGITENDLKTFVKVLADKKKTLKLPQRLELAELKFPKPISLFRMVKNEGSGKPIEGSWRAVDGSMPLRPPELNAKERDLMTKGYMPSLGGMAPLPPRTIFLSLAK